jgi:hypothetical protein
MPQPVDLRAHLRVESNHVIRVAIAWLKEMHKRFALDIGGLREERQLEIDIEGLSGPDLFCALLARGIGDVIESSMSVVSSLPVSVTGISAYLRGR